MTSDLIKRLEGAETGAFAEGTANEVDSNGLAVYINP